MRRKFGAFMEREILESPQIAQNLLNRVLPLLEKNRQILLEAAKQGITFVARGSSDNACLYGKYAFEIVIGLPSHLAAPSVITLYHKKLAFDGRLVIGASQSGKSSDVCAYLEAAKDGGALCLAITNDEKSPLAKTADIVLPLHCGKERAVAATKTYIAELLVLRILVSVLAGNKRLMNTLEQIPKLLQRAISSAEIIQTLAPRYRYMSAAVVLGRGFNYSTAQEFALKLMETSYVPVHPFSFADFLHGPVAVLHEGFPTFVFVSRGPAEKPVRALLGDIERRGGETVVFTDVSSLAKRHPRAILVPQPHNELDSPMLLIIPAYFFALELARQRGYDPDNPRGLSKVTLTL